MATLISPKTDISELCERCHAIPLRTVNAQSASTFLDFVRISASLISLGTLEEVSSRASFCVLCRAIQSFAQSSLPTAHKQGKNTESVVCSLAIYSVGKIHAFKEYEPDSFREKPCVPLSEDKTFRAKFLLHSSVNSNEGGLAATACVESIEFHLGYNSSSQRAPFGEEDASCLGRPRGAFCDFQLIRAWFSECEQIHHWRCFKKRLLGAVSRTRPEQRSLRLVDVIDQCLTTTNSFNDYVALSYVWGVKEQKVRLTREEEGNLHVKGALKDPSRVIQDAMKVTKELGMKYLWVDVLCVMQDDPKDKEVDIQNMYWIYTNAKLTIVAAGGGTANDGLSGISVPRPEQFVIPIGNGLCLYSTATQPTISTKGLELSRPWSTRGWTLQEQVLSRRCLFFVDDQVFWRCPMGDWFEDIDLEQGLCYGNHLRAAWSREKPIESPSIVQQPVKHAANMFNIENDNDFEPNFKALVEAYAHRTLSFDSDVACAFQGILSGLDHEFHHGLPANRFEEYLCWQDCGAENGRPPLQLRKENVEPTWSWMSWKGSLTYSYVNTNTRPKVVCFRLANSKTDHLGGSSTDFVPLRPVTQQRFSNKINGRRESRWRLEGIMLKDIWDADIDWNTLKSQTDTPRIKMGDYPELTENHLLFTTDVVELKIEESKLSPRDATNAVKPREYEVFSPKSPDRETVISFHQYSQSDTAVFNAGIESSSHVQSFFAIATYRARRDVLVMRVSWKGNIAYREGVHFVRRNIWEKLEKQPKLIILG